ncbi:MAG: tRNA (N6-threonylcarbamoyladenosine(37)-N6)-methyltransferase TrmO [bacterium]
MNTQDNLGSSVAPLPIVIHAIGVIHTPFRVQQGTPIQPYAARDIPGDVLVFPEYRAGLKNLQGFERIWLIYWFHRASVAEMQVIPYRDVVARGLFATRAPNRPNPIGLSCVRLREVDVAQGILKIIDVDMLDETPLLDIKPYVPQFDSHPETKAGWLDETQVERNVANGRFADSKRTNVKG